MTDIGQYEQFWLGAYTTERHGEGNPGEWIWPHMNKTVEWADWADGEPNNYGHEVELSNCDIYRGELMDASVIVF